MYKNLFYFKRLSFLILYAKSSLKNDIPLQLETEGVQRFISKFILCYFAPHFVVVVICLVFVIGLRNVFLELAGLVLASTRLRYL